MFTVLCYILFLAIDSVRPLHEPHNSTTILLIDDEEEIRIITTRMLNRLGYTVLEAANGLSGLALLAKHPAPIALALIDLTMPQMNGGELAHHLRDLYPNLPIILMSGYNEVDARAQMPNTIIDQFLQKPFTFTSLRHVLQQIFDEQS